MTASSVSPADQSSNRSASPVPYQSHRLRIMLGFLAGAALLIAALTLALPFHSNTALSLLAYGTAYIFESTYPFTIQNGLHLLTASGFGLLFIRWRRTRHEEAHQ